MTFVDPIVAYNRFGSARFDNLDQLNMRGSRGGVTRLEGEDQNSSFLRGD